MLTSTNVSAVERLLHLGTGYQVSAVLFTSARLGIFKAIGKKGVTLNTLAQQLKISGSALGRLLRVLAALGLVVKRGDLYKPISLSSGYFAGDGDMNFEDIVTHLETLQNPWKGLDSALKQNSMVPPGKKALADYAHQLKKHLQAMHALGLVKGTCIKKIFPVKKYRRMLDLGGGLGTYTVSFARENKNLYATIFDLKTVYPHTSKYIRECGLEKRVRCIAGECLTDQLPEGPYDLVFISNLLHIYGSKDCRNIVKKAVKVLARQGTLLVHDYILGCGKPLAASLFDITMLVGTPEGRCPEKEKLSAWMRAAGITNIKSKSIGAGTSIMWGARNKN
jgi:predicted O-methyltransferase YrrM